MQPVDFTGEPATEDFARLVDPYRRELLAHCYRMLGSVQDAEDLLQETLIRAWRGFAGFEGRSSLRTWLYRIATRACLTELERGHRRVMPSGLGAPQTDFDGSLPAAPAELLWLQPIPDALWDGGTDDPAAIAQRRDSTRLALIAAMQLLPARQRAVLILRDVLGWRAAEVAELLDTTTAAVNSALVRSRAQVARSAPAEDEIDVPAPGRRSVLERYVTAFADADISGLVTLLQADVELEMPPMPLWFAGRDAVARFFDAHLAPAGRYHLVPIQANGRPAAAAYRRDDDGLLVAHSVHLLSVIGGRIARIAVFVGPAQLTPFGLPPTLSLPHGDEM